MDYNQVRCTPAVLPHIYLNGEKLRRILYVLDFWCVHCGGACKIDVLDGCLLLYQGGLQLVRHVHRLITPTGPQWLLELWPNMPNAEGARLQLHEVPEAPLETLNQQLQLQLCLTYQQLVTTGQRAPLHASKVFLRCVFLLRYAHASEKVRQVSMLQPMHLLDPVAQNMHHDAINTVNRVMNQPLDVTEDNYYRTNVAPTLEHVASATQQQQQQILGMPGMFMQPGTPLQLQPAPPMAPPPARPALLQQQPIMFMPVQPQAPPPPQAAMQAYMQAPPPGQLPKQEALPIPAVTGPMPPAAPPPAPPQAPAAPPLPPPAPPTTQTQPAHQSLFSTQAQQMMQQVAQQLQSSSQAATPPPPPGPAPAPPPPTHQQEIASQQPASLPGGDVHAPLPEVPEVKAEQAPPAAASRQGSAALPTPSAVVTAQNNEPVAPVQLDETLGLPLVVSNRRISEGDMLMDDDVGDTGGAAEALPTDDLGTKRDAIFLQEGGVTIEEDADCKVPVVRLKLEYPLPVYLVEALQLALMPMDLCSSIEVQQDLEKYVVALPPSPESYQTLEFDTEVPLIDENEYMEQHGQKQPSSSAQQAGAISRPNLAAIARARVKERLVDDDLEEYAAAYILNPAEDGPAGMERVEKQQLGAATAAAKIGGTQQDSAAVHDEGRGRRRSRSRSQSPVGRRDDTGRAADRRGRRSTSRSKSRSRSRSPGRGLDRFRNGAARSRSRSPRRFISRSRSRSPRRRDEPGPSRIVYRPPSDNSCSDSSSDSDSDYAHTAKGKARFAKPPPKGGIPKFVSWSVAANTQRFEPEREAPSDRRHGSPPRRGYRSPPRARSPVGRDRSPIPLPRTNYRSPGEMPMDYDRGRMGPGRGYDYGLRGPGRPLHEDIRDRIRDYEIQLCSYLHSRGGRTLREIKADCPMPGPVMNACEGVWGFFDQRAHLYIVTRSGSTVDVRTGWWRELGLPGPVDGNGSGWRN